MIFKRQISILLLTFALAKSAPSDSRSIVDVKVYPILARSADNGPAFRVKINGNRQGYNLTLQNPTSSIFSKTFQYTVVEEDAQGNIIYKDDTPSEDGLQQIENKIFVDPESKSALTLSHQDGSYKIQGLIDDSAIIPGDQKYTVVQVKAAVEPGVNDYIDLHRNITHSPSATRAAVTAQPEVWVIFDYDNSQTFGQDRNKILDYLGVFFHAINNRYATFSDPSISFRIAGVTTMASRSAQPFMENNKVPDGSGYDINKVLDDFSRWAYANQNSGPKFDTAAVISGTDFQSKDSSGAYSKGVAGLAYLKAACWKTSDRWFATSVTEDRGGYYDGMFSVAHELAHNLGAPHDGSDGASACSWEDGYIMSYKGWGTANKFTFSSCSKSLMSNYITSNQGACLKTIDSSTTVPISSDNVGDRYSMTALCVKYTSQPKAVPESTKTADQLCKNLSCRYPTPGKPDGYYTITTMNHPPGDNTPCGSGGRCISGNCVV